MEISQQQIDDFRREREALARETAYLRKREKHFRKLTKANRLDLTISWIADLDSIDLSQLKSPLQLKCFPDDYRILWAKTDALCEAMGEGMSKVFPKNRLWVKRSPFKITEGLDFVDKGNMLIPIILQVIPDGRIIVLDGNHRFALSRYLKIDEIPFLMDNTSIERLNGIGIEYRVNQP